ncbi:MAG: hypothetical protein KC496_03195, partial [Anaerolineae bacterium]|nr:hypothetical protein [Anaerolineae bacterium]
MKTNRQLWYLGLILMNLLSFGSAVAQDIVQPESVNILTVNGTVVGMALNPEGTLLAVADDSQVVTLFDLETGNSLNQHPVGASDLFDEGGVHYSPDGTHIAVSSFSFVRLFDGETGALNHEISTDSDDMAFSPDGTQLYVLANDVITVYDSTSGTATQSVAVGAPDDGRAASKLEVQADGSLVLLVPDESYNYYITTLSPDFGTTATTSNYALDLVAGADALFSVYYTNLTAYMDLESTGVPMMASTVCGDFTAYALNPQATLLAALADNCALHIFDTLTGEERYLESLTNAGQLAFGADALYVSVGAQVNRYAVDLPVAANDSTSADVAADATTNTDETSLPTTNVRYELVFDRLLGPGDTSFAGVAVSPAGDKVAGITGFSNLIIAYNTADGTEIGRYERSAGSGQIAYSADGTYLVAIDADSHLFVLDATTMTPVSEAQLAGDFSAELVADATSAYVYTNVTGETTQYLNKIDLASGEIVAQVAVFNDVTIAHYLAILPDGTLIGVGGTDSGTQIKNWDTNLNELSALSPWYWTVGYAEDIYVYATARRGDDGTIYTYNQQSTFESEPMILGEDTCLYVDFATAEDTT